MPSVRAERFKFLLQKFRCPSLTYSSGLYGSAPDLKEFQKQAPWPAVSYLMPVYFQYWGQRNQRVLCYDEKIKAIPVMTKAAPDYPDWEVRVDDYVPRIDRVGAAARKIFAADGTRYVTYSTFIDIEVAPIPNWNGAFADWGAWYCGSQAYGVKSDTLNWDNLPVPDGSESQGQNLTVSYRHGGQAGCLSGDAHDNRGLINAVFFDGHVERLTDRQSRQVHLWYPSGTVVQNPSSGMTDVPVGYVVP